MKIYKYLWHFIFFCLVFIAGSCSKQKFAANNDLDGTWKWLRTDGGIGYNIHETPASTGKSIDLNFTGDGKYSIYTNGVVSSQGTYSLEERNCIHDHTDKNFINFSAVDDHDIMVESLDGYNLDLSDENYDGVGSQYSRK